MECQEGIVGGGGKLGMLAEAVARHGTIDSIARCSGRTEGRRRVVTAPGRAAPTAAAQRTNASS